MQQRRRSAISAQAHHDDPGLPARRCDGSLNDALRKSLEDAEVKKRIASEGGAPTPTSPQALASFIKSETANFEKIIKTAGIKLE
jgi:tripartite-type tricarboxylate transporter receptor subunit TctC